MAQRIQKILAEAGVCSRRAAEDLIRQGRVTVDGRVATLGQKADLKDDIRLDGRPLQPQPTETYLFHKPKGVITTLNDPQGRASLAPYVQELGGRVYPVGRLDANASGLLLLTNDGQLAQRLLHPRFEVDKVYDVRVRGRADEAALNKLAAGVMVGRRLTAPAQVQLLFRRGKSARLRLIIHEGRHHQVKRMCAQVGLRVEELRRVRFGPLRLKGLRPGQMRLLEAGEVAALKKAVGQA